MSVKCSLVLHDYRFRLETRVSINTEFRNFILHCVSHNTRGLSFLAALCHLWFLRLLSASNNIFFQRAIFIPDYLLVILLNSLTTYCSFLKEVKQM